MRNDLQLLTILDFFRCISFSLLCYAIICYYVLQEAIAVNKREKEVKKEHKRMVTAGIINIFLHNIYILCCAVSLLHLSDE